MFSTKTHGILDYSVGLLLILSPWIFGFNNSGTAATIPIVLGVLAILYSLITRYEYSVIKLLPFSTHLIIDAVSGIFLAASPWLFGFSDFVYLPHLIMGLMEVTAVLLTDKRPGAIKRYRHT